MENGDGMPYSIRFSDKVERILDEWIEAGYFDSRAEAIRAALNMMDRIIDAKKKGRHIVALRDEDVDKVSIALQIA